MALKTNPDKVCLITGGSSGIGKSLAVEFASLGFHVIILSRNERELKRVKQETDSVSGAGKTDYYPIDLSLGKEIRDFAAFFSSNFNRLDVLVNNAGVNLPQKKVTKEGIEYMFAVNHLAPFLLTRLLIDKLIAAGNAQVINIVSNGEKFARFDVNNLQAWKGYNGTRHYCLTKLCNLMFSYELARRFRDEGITSNAVHPGGVRTNIMKTYHPFSLPAMIWKILSPSLQTSEKAAKNIIGLFKEGIFRNETGKYYFRDKPAKSSPASCREDFARQLWEISEKLTGLNQ